MNLSIILALLSNLKMLLIIEQESIIRKSWKRKNEGRSEF